MTIRRSKYVNKLRTYGFERITFIRGEEYLLLIKTTEEEDAEPDDPQALKFDNGAYATGNAPCEISCCRWAASSRSRPS